LIKSFYPIKFKIASFNKLTYSYFYETCWRNINIEHFPLKLSVDEGNNCRMSTFVLYNDTAYHLHWKNMLQKDYIRVHCCWQFLNYWL